MHLSRRNPRHILKIEEPQSTRTRGARSGGDDMHTVQQPNGTMGRIASEAQIRVISEPWDMGAVYYPYMVYVPEKDRLLMLVNWGQDIKSGLSLSDDGGMTWTRPQPLGEGMGIDLTYIGGGSVVYRRAGRYWFSRDCGQTWNDHVTVPDCDTGEEFVEDSPFLVDGKAITGKVRLWATGKSTRVACLLRHSDDGGFTWSACRHIPEWGQTGEIVLHRADNGTLVAACRLTLPQFRGKIDHHSGLGVSISRDNGETWSDLNILYAWGRHMSSMVTLDTGHIVLTYVVRMGYVDTPEGYPQFGVEAITSSDNGLTWDLDHKYMLAVWRGNRKGRDGWQAGPQRTATVLLPEGLLVTAFGTGYRTRGKQNKRTHSPQDIGLVHWRFNTGTLSPDTTITAACCDSDARNIFDPHVSRYCLNDPG